MTFDFVNQPFFEKLVRILCLTLMHSLWQGLIVSVLAGAVLMLTKKSKPSTRYNLLVFLLTAFVMASGITFWTVNQQNVDVSGNAVLSFQTVSSAGYIQKTVQNETDLVSLVTHFCDKNANVIVAIWFLMFAFKSFRATTGFLYLKKIRNTNIQEPTDDWKAKFAILGGKLKITRSILLKESANVTVPMVIGFFKPIVLVPLGMLANLPALQIEAILLHELAHIRRKDYLVNLMQIFCENIFFFNPAVLWISFLIREEREHCCDDLAIEVMQNKTSFVHALVSFQEYNLAASSIALTFSKKRNHLLDRVKRIINNNNKPLDAMEKLFVTISLFSAALLSAAVSHVAPEPARSLAAHKEKQSITAILASPTFTNVQSDTLPKKKSESSTVIHSSNVYSGTEGVSTYNIHMDGKAYDIVQKAGKTIHLSIDGKKIPESEFASYQKEINEIMAKVKVAHEQAEADRGDAEKQREQADVRRKEAEEQRAVADQQRVQADKMRGEANYLRQQAESSRKQADENRIQADKMRDHADLARKDAEIQRINSDKHREEADVARARAKELRYAAEKERAAYEQMQNDLINDLIAAGVIKGKADLSYKLSQEELVVNGAKQSAELHKKLKDKYIQLKAVEMVYHYRGRTGYTTTGFIYTK